MAQETEVYVNHKINKESFSNTFQSINFIMLSCCLSPTSTMMCCMHDLHGIPPHWHAAHASVHHEVPFQPRSNFYELLHTSMQFLFYLLVKDVPKGDGPHLEVLQYQGNPWDGRSKLHSASRFAKIELIAWGHCPR